MMDVNGTSPKHGRVGVSLLELLEYKHRDLADASDELKTALCLRWQHCKALEECKRNDFCELCDCRVILDNKLRWQPEYPTAAQVRRHEKQFAAAWTYVCTNASHSSDKWLAATDQLLKYQHDYAADVMTEAIKIIKQLNTQTC